MTFVSLDLVPPELRLIPKGTDLLMPHLHRFDKVTRDVKMRRHQMIEKSLPVLPCIGAELQLLSTVTQ